MSLPNTDANGVILTKANGIPVYWNRGLGYDVNGNLCVTSVVSATDVWMNGWRMDSMGRLIVNQSTPEGKPFVYNAGWPCDKNTGMTIRQTGVPSPTDPLVAGVAIDPAGGVYMTGGAPVTWTPAELFLNGEVGPWFNISDLDTLFQDSAGTVPVVADGDPVGFITDLSGNGLNAIFTPDTARPVYRTNGINSWIEFDGVDDVAFFNYAPISSLGFAACAGIDLRGVTLATVSCNLFDSDDGVHRVGQFMAFNTSSAYTIYFNTVQGYINASINGLTTHPYGPFFTQLDPNLAQTDMLIRAELNGQSQENPLAGAPVTDVVTVYLGDGGWRVAPYIGRMYSLVSVNRALEPEEAVSLIQWSDDLMS